MSTRACYTFKDKHNTIHVYKHNDGYPTGAAEHIARALPYAWPLPRFEAVDFAAAFVAANKTPHWLQQPIADLLETLATSEKPESYEVREINMSVRVPPYAYGKSPIGQGGGVYLMRPGSIYATCPADIEYRYEISQGKNGALHVNIFLGCSFGQARKIDPQLHP
jgi:hypothetical protein